MESPSTTPSPTAESDSPWLVTWEAPASHIQLRLFCFHHAGASASTFRAWQGQLPQSVQIIAVQLPGREYRMSEPLLSDMREIVAALMKVMPPLLDKPYAFFGHSMGALLGFELARMLRAHALPPPVMLFVSGRTAPQFRWRDPATRLLPDDELVAAVRDYNGTPEELLSDISLRELWLPRFRADLTASVMYDYIAQAPLNLPLVVMSGESDPLVFPEGLRGWAEHSARAVKFFSYPGDHFFLFSAEADIIEQVLAELRPYLTRTR